MIIHASRLLGINILSKSCFVMFTSYCLLTDMIILVVFVAGSVADIVVSRELFLVTDLAFSPPKSKVDAPGSAVQPLSISAEL